MDAYVIMVKQHIPFIIFQSYLLFMISKNFFSI